VIETLEDAVSSVGSTSEGITTSAKLVSYVWSATNINICNLFQAGRFDEAGITGGRRTWVGQPLVWHCGVRPELNRLLPQPTLKARQASVNKIITGCWAKTCLGLTCTIIPRKLFRSQINPPLTYSGIKKPHMANSYGFGIASRVYAQLTASSTVLVQ